MHRIHEKITDGRVLALIEMFLQQGILGELARWTPETGSPQGAVISPLLSNNSLDPLDHLLAKDVAGAGTITAGRIPILPSRGCFP